MQESPENFSAEESACFERDFSRRAKRLGAEWA
jgi:hypothetical protein